MGGIRRLLLLLVLAAPLHYVQSQESLPAQVCFVFWNLKNYTGLAAPNAPPAISAPRKSSEAAAVIHQVLLEARPDILLLAEMGTLPDLQFLQQVLKEGGLDLPFREYVDGPDPDRHVALLSRFPLTSHSRSDIKFDIGGRVDRVHRGLLDVEVTVGPQKVRLLGVHLKSRRQEADVSEQEIRRSEAYQIRKHLKAILADNSETAILLAGDLNETKEGPAIRGLAAGVSDPDRIRWLGLEDAEGNSWTYYFPVTDTYSRIDYAGISRAFRWKVDRSSRVGAGDRRVLMGSDHRPLIVVFNTESK